VPDEPGDVNELLLQRFTKSLNLKRLQSSEQLRKKKQNQKQKGKEKFRASLNGTSSSYKGACACAIGRLFLYETPECSFRCRGASCSSWRVCQGSSWHRRHRGLWPQEAFSFSLFVFFFLIDAF
jgi:hypothetical protein